MRKGAEGTGPFRPLCGVVVAALLGGCGSAAGDVPPAAPSASLEGEARAAPASTPSARSSPEPDEVDACPGLTVPVPEADDAPVTAPTVLVADPAGSLTSVHARLAALGRGRGSDHLRIAMYGDSNLTRDEVSGEIRRLLQAGFGDGGHGYVAVGRPWPWYVHQDVVHGLEPKAWRSHAVSTHAVADQVYGFGGIAAHSISDGARAWVATAPEGAPVGTLAARFDVYYLKHRLGRELGLFVDGTEAARLDTRSPVPGVGVHRLDVLEGPHRVTLSAGTGVRLFGVAVERATPGVVLDSLGVGGASVVHLARMRRPQALEALRHRRHDLVMFLTGSTEDDDDRHDVALEHLVELHREASPGSACLVFSPPDFAYGTIHAPKPSKRVGRLAKRKRAVAERLGCAFWDFRAAMGGEMSIVRFAHHGLAWRDMVHLTDRGARVMARRFVRALHSDLAARLAADPNLGCAPQPSGPGPGSDAARPAG